MNQSEGGSVSKPSTLIVDAIPNRSLTQLRFPAALETEYWRDRTRAYIPVLRFSVSLIVLLYFVFFSFDYLILDRFTGSAAPMLILGVAAPTALLGISITYAPVSYQWMRRGIFTAAAVNGVAIAFACMPATDGRASAPYECLLIYMVYVYFLLGTSNRAALQLALAIAALSIGGSIWAGESSAAIYDHTLMFIIIIAVGGLSSRIMELAERKAWFNERRLRELAERDALTGLLNQRAFFERVDAILTAAQVNDSQHAVLMLGFRHLRSYNHQFDNPLVDNCQRQIAQYLASRLPRPQDLIARLGGEQFVVFLGDCDVASAQQFAEKICIDLDQLRIPHPGAPLGMMTAIVSMTHGRALELGSGRSAAQAADEALVRLIRSANDRVARVESSQSISAWHVASADGGPSLAEAKSASSR